MRECVRKGCDPCARLPPCAPSRAPTQDSDVCVGFLRRIRVELAHVASLIGEWHIGQRHPQFVVREIHQLEPAVLQSCGDTCETETVWIQSAGTQTWDKEWENVVVVGGGEWEVERGENERGDGRRQKESRGENETVGERGVWVCGAGGGWGVLPFCGLSP